MRRSKRSLCRENCEGRRVWGLPIVNPDGRRTESLASKRALSVVSGLRRPLATLLLLYPAGALIAGSQLDGVTTAVAALVLAVAHATCVLLPWRPGCLVTGVTCVLVIPIVLQPQLGAAAVVAAVPALPSVAVGLQGMARVTIPDEADERPALSRLGRSVLLALGALGVFAVFVSSSALLCGCGLLGLLLGGAALVAVRRLRGGPLCVDAASASVVVGKPVKARVLVVSRDGLRVHVWLGSAAGGVVVTPERFSLESSSATLTVEVTPSLGGPTVIRVVSVVSDGWGLLCVRQELTVLHIDVIPRARVARRAARVFLEGGGNAGGLSTPALSGAVRRFLSSGGGVEYLSSRLYASGDRATDIDWKHTAKLQTLTVKTYADDSNQSGLIAVNLVVSDAEEADRLVYELLSAALTVAQMSLRCSIASYDDGEVHALSAPLDGKELVKQALAVGRELVLGPRWSRVLKVVSLHDIALARERLQGVESDAGVGLREILGLEERALGGLVGAHPASSILETGRRRYSPGWLVAISNMSHDAEAVATGIREIERRGVRTLVLNIGSEAS